MENDEVPYYVGGYSLSFSEPISFEARAKIARSLYVLEGLQAINNLPKTMDKEDKAKLVKLLAKYKYSEVLEAIANIAAETEVATEEDLEELTTDLLTIAHNLNF